LSERLGLFLNTAGMGEVKRDQKNCEQSKNSYYVAKLKTFDIGIYYSYLAYSDQHVKGGD
jgi:hypothetical protein